MGRVLKNPEEVREFFFKHMAKNDLLTKIEQGDVVPKPTVLKWLHNNSSWEDRITHSGQLESCLKGSGFAFQSFDHKATNGKETICILNIQRSKINWIKTIGGRGYLDNFQSSAKSRFYTCTLSVLVAAAPFMGSEVNNMVRDYLVQEKSFKLAPDKNTIVSRLLGEGIKDLEIKYGLKMSKIGRSSVFSMANKIANFTLAPATETADMILKFIDSTITDSEYGFKYKNARNLIEEVATIVDKTIFWVTAPEAAITSEIKKTITKSTTEIRKPITNVKTKINVVKTPATKTKQLSKDIKTILGKK